MYVVLVMPSSLAASFIFLTNASWSPPESQRASSRATLLAEGIMIAARASYSLILSPALSVPTVDSPSELLAPSSTAVLSMSISGPFSPFLRGWFFRITYAVMVFATLPMATGFCSPKLPTVPRPAAAM